VTVGLGKGHHRAIALGLSKELLQELGFGDEDVSFLARCEGGQWSCDRRAWVVCVKLVGSGTINTKYLQVPDAGADKLDEVLVLGSSVS
jgi:hypothetical protein